MDSACRRGGNVGERSGGVGASSIVGGGGVR